MPETSEELYERALHWWFLARPARLPQLKTNLVAIWDDVLPPLPEGVWRENLATVVEALG
jgi:hypothetical protein